MMQENIENRKFKENYILLTEEHKAIILDLIALLLEAQSDD